MRRSTHVVCLCAVFFAELELSARSLRSTSPQWTRSTAWSSRRPGGALHALASKGATEVSEGDRRGVGSEESGVEERSMWQEMQWTPDLPYEPKGVPSRRKICEWEQNLINKGLDRHEHVEPATLEPFVEAALQLQVTYETEPTPQPLPQHHTEVPPPSPPRGTPTTPASATLPPTMPFSSPRSSTSAPSPPSLASTRLTTSTTTTRQLRLRPLRVNLDLIAYHARVARRKNNYTKAVALWRRALELDPADGRPWLSLAKYEWQVCQDVHRAREIFKLALHACPESPFLLQASGHFEEVNGNTAKAMQRYMEATRADPSHAASWISRGNLERKVGRPALARACYKRAVVANNASYVGWSCWARLEADLGFVDTARKLYRRSVDAGPRNAFTFQCWALLEHNHGNAEGALRLLKRASKLSPRNTIVIQKLAELEARRGNHLKAIKLLERAINTRPQDAGVHQAYAEVSKELGDVEGARRLFRLGIRANRKYLPLYKGWAQMEIELSNYNAARDVFQQGVWAAPKGKKVEMLWTAWANFEASLGDLRRAREYFKYSLDSASESTVSTKTLVEWALVEEKFGHPDRARSLFDTACQVDEANAWLWRQYEDFERRQGDLDVVQRVSDRMMAATTETIAPASLDGLIGPDELNEDKWTKPREKPVEEPPKTVVTWMDKITDLDEDDAWILSGTLE